MEEAGYWDLFQKDVYFLCFCVLSSLTSTQ